MERDPMFAGQPCAALKSTSGISRLEAFVTCEATHEGVSLRTKTCIDDVSLHNN